jgi:hypothetical protein
VLLMFDFGRVPLNGNPLLVPPGKSMLFYRMFTIPRSVWGIGSFEMKYRMEHFSRNVWNLTGNYNINQNYFVNIIPRRQINSSQYHLFVSRSVRGEDRPIGDFIAQRLVQWNFTTCTVGIEVPASRADTSRAIRNEIQKADGVVAIATPRNLDQITQTWKTLEWLHSEVGIAYGINKPLLIFSEKSVRLEALPHYLPSFDCVPKIDFSSTDLNRLSFDIDCWMPSYRESLKKQRVDRFFSNILTTGVYLLAGIKGSELLKNAFDGFISNQRD